MSNVTITAPSMYTAPASTTLGSYYSTATNAASLWWGSGSNNTWTSGTSGTTFSTGNLNSSFSCGTDLEVEGDIKWKGRSLGKLLETIEDRLAILQEPDPKKIEKFAALKKAYDHYKMIEKLIGEEE